MPELLLSTQQPSTTRHRPKKNGLQDNMALLGSVVGGGLLISGLKAFGPQKTAARLVGQERLINKALQSGFDSRDVAFFRNALQATTNPWTRVVGGGLSLLAGGTYLLAQ